MYMFLWIKIWYFVKSAFLIIIKNKFKINNCKNLKSVNLIWFDGGLEIYYTNGKSEYIYFCESLNLMNAT